MTSSWTSVRSTRYSLTQSRLSTYHSSTAWREAVPPRRRYDRRPCREAPLDDEVPTWSPRDEVIANDTNRRKFLGAPRHVAGEPCEGLSPTGQPWKICMRRCAADEAGRSICRDSHVALALNDFEILYRIESRAGPRRHQPDDAGWPALAHRRLPPYAGRQSHESFRAWHLGGAKNESVRSLSQNWTMTVQEGL